MRGAAQPSVQRAVLAAVEQAVHLELEVLGVPHRAVHERAVAEEVSVVSKAVVVLVVVVVVVVSITQP